MPLKRHWFRDRRTVHSAGGTYDDIRWEPPVKDALYRLTSLAVEDETSAPSGDIRVHIEGHGYNHPLLEEDSPAAATLYWADKEEVVLPGEVLVARITGATSADVLQLYLAGYYTLEGVMDA